MEDQGYWDGNEERVYDEGPSELQTYIRVNGSDRPIEVGSNLVRTIKETARDAGLGKFRVFMDGQEIRPSEAPDQVTEGMGLELRPYDIAGS